MLNLNDIIGQDEAVGRLRTNFSAGRVPHAFLFAGPEGVGRRTTAAALAAELLCESPRTDLTGQTSACGTCESCRMLRADAHPDFQLVYKELARFHDDAAVRGRVMQDLGIDVIRSFLIAPAGRSSTRGRGKVFVVLESDLLSIAAQNALLKTLEEPPAGVTIILICRRPEQLLPTTRSRCSLVRFGPLPRDFVTGKLAEEGVASGEAEFWASLTDGSLGRALKLARAGLYEIKREVVDGLSRLPAGGDAKFAETLAKHTDALAEAEVKLVKKEEDANLSKALAVRRASGAMLEILAAVYRDALSCATGAEQAVVHADQMQAVQAIAGRFEPVELAEILEQLSRYERLLWRNVNPKIVWDNVVITCASATTLNV
ncbi:MAG: hypothetical protein JXA11_03430 [Phycisphaerae bacterium]|nr:hypothetical protein [Phycisphaerae bacterium]